MKYKLGKKYSCENCGTEKVHDCCGDRTYLVYCQEGDSFWQQFACCRECHNILEDAHFNPILYECSKCKKGLPAQGTYEYRGAKACKDCFDDVVELRDFERQEIMDEERHKTDRFKNLDMSDSPIGRINRDIMKRDIEIASKESGRIKKYESN